MSDLFLIETGILGKCWLRLKKCHNCLAQMMLYLTKKLLRKSQYSFMTIYSRIHRNFVFFTSKTWINSTVSHKEDALSEINVNLIQKRRPIIYFRDNTKRRLTIRAFGSLCFLFKIRLIVQSKNIEVPMFGVQFQGGQRTAGLFLIVFPLLPLKM